MPLHCTCMRTDRSLVRNERHYLMDKKNDHPCKHSQRDSFIDTRAASHCYAFHSFPHPDDSASCHMQSRCTASVNEALSAALTERALDHLGGVTNSSGQASQ